MDNFNAGEIFQFAIKIEENGEAFYRKLAASVDNKETKELFELLANEEVSHGVVFRDILAKFQDYSDTEIYPEEYFAYIRALADNMIFNLDLDKEMEKIKTKDDAIKFAMQKEWEAILYYQEIKNLVPENEKEHIEKLIQEEREHFLKLSEYQS